MQYVFMAITDSYFQILPKNTITKIVRSDIIITDLCKLRSLNPKLETLNPETLETPKILTSSGLSSTLSHLNGFRAVPRRCAFPDLWRIQKVDPLKAPL